MIILAIFAVIGWIGVLYFASQWWFEKDINEIREDSIKRTSIKNPKKMTKHDQLVYLVGYLLPYMESGNLNPDEIVSCAQQAASLYRAGDEAIEKYFADNVIAIGTDGELVP